ncbi:MAG: preprotein translocase subunit SecE [Acidimicrobiia bacterium]|nr:preprotein translocase subunit SecE [Acidimicrobiia bacterium]MDH4305868.1 preprotein translocase subunit SecE [Acidimicrobiia bacterium]MDH5294201.1 preprotein translocase subunit SecE [Acidimicrobiia bacterium]MDH5522271.1 preprotein translocase subunit SecE [Acidimicrobiia bacterium]
MNREMRRMMEREERRQKKQEQRQGGRAAANQRAQAALQRSKGERQPFFKRIAQFLHDVRVEMRKVSWPTRDQMVAFSVVTLVTSIVLTAFVFGLDAGLKELVFLAIGGANG